MVSDLARVEPTCPSYTHYLACATAPIYGLGCLVVPQKVTVGGMRTLLAACKAHGVKKVCFSDSIGSFGHSSPRVDATAAWLVANPEQVSERL